MDRIYAMTGELIVWGLIIYGFKCIMRQVLRG